MPQFLSKDIQFSIDDLIESSRLISADGLGVSSADVSFGTLDDQWVLEAMADGMNVFILHCYPTLTKVCQRRASMGR